MLISKDTCVFIFNKPFKKLNLQFLKNIFGELFANYKRFGSSEHKNIYEALNQRQYKCILLITSYKYNKSNKKSQNS